MKPFSLFFLAATIQAAPITASPVTLSNFQSTATVSVSIGFSLFSGFQFSPISDWDGIQVVLPLGSGGMLRSNPTNQSIFASASADFDAPGYRVIGISLMGVAVDDGGSAGEAFGVTGLGAGACTLAMSGSLSHKSGTCPIPEGGLESGTVTAWMRMYSDSRLNRSDTGQLINPEVVLTVIHNPEPVTFLLIAGGLIGIGLIGKKR